MNSKRYLQLLVAAAVLGSCSEQGLKEIGQIDQTIPGVTFKIDPFESSTTANVFDTRTTVTPGETYNVTWAGGDVIGVFPENGYQVPFQITESQIGQSSAQFDGGYWAIKDGLKYNAYYPINKDFDLNENYQTHIPVTYAGQQQTGQTCCAGAYDYTYSDWNTAADGTVGFNFHHIGAIVELTLPIQTTATYTSLTLAADSSVIPLTGYYDLTSDKPTFVADGSSMTSSLTVALNGFSATAGQSVKVYFMLPPINFTSTSIQARIYAETNVYTYTLLSPKIEASKIIRLTGKYKNASEHEYVDLGLSVKWATMNVGATSATDFGDYFSWGATEPLYEHGYSQENPQAHWNTGKSSGYTWGNTPYQTAGAVYDYLTVWRKYLGDTPYFKDSTATDEDALKTVLDASDDAASANWGGSWRMPTRAERDELLNTANCSWTWYGSGNAEFNGVSGYKVTSKKSGYEGKSIFLPAAGYREGTSLSAVGTYGYYWCSSLGTENAPKTAYGLYFWESKKRALGQYRYYGLSIRPVCQ